MDPTTAALPAVAIEALTTALPTVAIDPATTALLMVLTDPATTALSVVATEPATVAGSEGSMTASVFTPRASQPARGRAGGMAARSSRVYSCSGALRSSAAGRYSTVAPSRSTSTSWLIRSTTARSCEMNR